MSTVLMYLGETCGNDWHQEAMGGFNSANMALCINNNAAFFQTMPGTSCTASSAMPTVLSRPSTMREGDESLRSLCKAQAPDLSGLLLLLSGADLQQALDDSNNGSSDGVVLRLDTSTAAGSLPRWRNVMSRSTRIATMRSVFFEESGVSVTDFYQPSINMAYGVRAGRTLP